ncbi:MAG: NUDIX domain-containing protein [Bacillota bacterium]
MSWTGNKSTTQKINRYEIVVDNVSLPNGEEKTFSYLQGTNGVCILPITDDHHILCLKQYRHPFNGMQWELPTGAIVENDASPLDSAKRKLEEETGYLAEHWLDLGSFYPSPGSTSEEIFLFAAAGLRASDQHAETSEPVELEKVSMEKLKALITDGEFNHGAGLATVLRYKFKTD